MARSPRLEDWAGIGLGAWLLASPWVLGFSHQAAATANAMLAGAILVVADIAALILDEKAHRRRVHRSSRRGPSDENGAREREQEPLAGLS